MGKLALAAKVTHVPSIYLSELDGPRKGTRQDAIDGLKAIGQHCADRGVDTIVVFDTHWLVNAGYHINCAPNFQGSYTSNELPHFIRNLDFGFPGNPALGKLLAKAKETPVVLVCAVGVTASATAQKLVKAGFKKVSVLDGGIGAWTGASLPLAKGKA